MPWYAPIIVGAMGVLVLWASRHIEAWVTGNQARTQRVFRTGSPQPGSWRARSLGLSRQYAKWFLVLSAVYLIVGAIVMAVIVVA